VREEWGREKERRWLGEKGKIESTQTEKGKKECGQRDM
jgi:hypothetical protein